ncbi:ATP-binding protein [Geopsychrobacter electrodiphilus]|uniref:ATP-binding protein n=1 Tax=Geopsychrobacter electrodiphilus TaxID=225196 RepID=UPI00036D8E6D|nr:ATP-binding protein [Geopsychrobacter electrodiphilus]
MTVPLVKIRSIALFFFAVLLLTATSTVGESAQIREILILHSYHPGFPWTDETMKGMQKVLANSEDPIHLHVEYLDTKRQPDPEYFTHVLDSILHYKLKNKKFDLILVSDNEALNFVIEHKRDLFAATPIVFCGIEKILPELYQDGAIITGVVESPDYHELLNTIISLQPDTREVVVIGNRRDLSGRISSDMFKEAALSYTGTLTFTYWDDIPADELGIKIENLKSGQVIFINGQVIDSSGQLINANARNSILRNNSPVALYGGCDLCLGHGIIGGPLVSPFIQGQLAAKLAVEILSGNVPEKGFVVLPDKPVPAFDYIQLKRFNIKFSSLPKGARLINQPQQFSMLPPKLFWAIIFGFVVALAVISFLINNILQRRKAEARTLESKQQYKYLNQQFQIILDGIPEGLTLISREMMVIWSNKGAGTDQFNNRPGTVPGKYCCEMLYNRAEICDNCPATLAFESGRASEAAITTPDNRILEVKAFPIRNEIGEVANVIVLASDITEKNRLREEGMQNSRLASLGELAAGVAHEINNPNALILLNAELIQKTYAAAAPILMDHFVREGDFLLGSLNYSEMSQELPFLFKEMLDSASHIKNIVHDLKDFARNDTADLTENVDFNEAVQAAVRLVNNTIKNSTDNFQTNYTSDLPIVCGNFQRVEQVVINLIVNSCQSLKNKNASLKLSTFYDPETKRNCLIVQDEGSGINPDVLPHITDPFFTTKREQGGTGLGLSVTSRIVQEHGGSLVFSSLPGAGTTATVSIPVQGQEAKC